jgi:hypothetical protein
LLRARDCTENALSHNASFYLKSSVMFGMPPLSIEAERKRCPADMRTVSFEREKAVGGNVNPGGSMVGGHSYGETESGNGHAGGVGMPKTAKRGGRNRMARLCFVCIFVRIENERAGKALY